MNKFVIYTLTVILISAQSVFAYINDDFADKMFKDKAFEKPIANLDYNYESAVGIPINLQIDEEISTKKDFKLQDGQKLCFTVENDVFSRKRKIIKKGTKVTATLETYISGGMNGVPGFLVIDDFNIPGIDCKKLSGEYSKRGISNTILVLPIKWALTPIPFVGSLTNLIPGFNATLKPEDTVTIYYYP